MKIKQGYLLREIAGKTVALPADDTLELNTMITLNETGAFLWKRLQNQTSEDELVNALLAEYDVTREKAALSVAAFVQKLDENGFLE